jgi:ATP-dependent exoDNAse (exonuclease V) alpha subunit
MIILYNDLIQRIISTQDNVVVHGLAGSGKSELIKEISNQMGKRCLLLAPTGNTALNIMGTTIDSLLMQYQYTPCSVLDEIENEYDAIILDEISMVDSIKLDCLYKIADALQKREKRIKLILVGDPFQLPPVVMDDKIKAYSKLKNKILMFDNFYFFKSKLFLENIYNTECYFLKRNYRQKDLQYNGVLQRIAMGLASNLDIEYLNESVISSENILTHTIPPIIVTTRNGFQYFNGLYLCQHEDIQTINPIFVEKKVKYENIMHECRHLISPLQYAIGVPVVFNQNDPNGQWVNGTKGYIVDQYRDGNRKLHLIVKTANNETIDCKQILHRIYRFIYNKKTHLVENKCVASIKQFPFILGFSLTVHKAQGMTLESMTFNISEGIFVPGQLYVALSRVRQFNNLILHVPLKNKDVLVSDHVKNYFDSFYKRCIEVE